MPASRSVAPARKSSRERRDSKRKRRADGRESSSDAASDRESESAAKSDQADGTEDVGDEERSDAEPCEPSTAPSDMPPQPTRALTPRDKFDRRYKTATNSNKEVLGASEVSCFNAL